MLQEVELIKDAKDTAKKEALKINTSLQVENSTGSKGKANSKNNKQTVKINDVNLIKEKNNLS